jgi:hypothetical protein
LLDGRQSTWKDLEESTPDALKIRVPGVQFPPWPFGFLLPVAS